MKISPSLFSAEHAAVITLNLAAEKVISVLSISHSLCKYSNRPCCDIDIKWHMPSLYSQDHSSVTSLIDHFQRIHILVVDHIFMIMAGRLYVNMMLSFTISAQTKENLDFIGCLVASH